MKAPAPIHRPLQVLAFLLACLMLAGSLVACADADTSGKDASGTSEATVDASQSGNDTSAATESDEHIPSIKKKDYNTDFNIVTVMVDQDWLVMEEEKIQSGNVLNETVFERCARIEDHLGVTCVLADAGDCSEYADKVTRTVQTGEDAYQLVTTHAHDGIMTLATAKNVLLDFADLPAIDLDASYWNKKVMEQLKISDRYVLGYSDLMLSNTHCVTFNKDLLNTYAMEAPYDLVRNKTWTLDKMFEMASIASKDNGDGVWDENDQYGLIGWGWIYLISFITSSDMTIVDVDPGTDLYTISFEREGVKLQDMIDKIYAMYTADYSFIWPSVPTVTMDISSGLALFQLYSTISLPALATSEIKFGVLPYPMYDTAQEDYKSLNWNGLMCVPASVANRQMVGEVLELLAYYSAPVKNAYYEVQLGTAVMDAQDDADMLDIIWESQSNDIGLACADYVWEAVYMVPRLCEAGSGNVSYYSYYKKFKQNANKTLKRIFFYT